MSRSEKVFDKIIEWGVIVLVIFTPLAFGSVEVWSREIMKLIIFIIAATWLLKKILTKRKESNSNIEEKVNSSRKTKKKFLRTGLEIPTIIFIAFILFQLIPLPPSALKVLSPHSYHLYKITLPGYDTPDGVNYEKLDQWLLEKEENLPEGLREIILDEKEKKTNQEFNIKSSNYRTISVYSYLTREQLILLLAYLAIFFIIIDHYRTRQKIYHLLLVIIISGLLIASFGIIQKLTWNGKIYWVRDPGVRAHPFGPFVNPDHFAGFMELIVPLAFGLFFTLISRKIETEEGKLKWKVDLGREGWNITEVKEFSIQKAVSLGFLLAITVASIFLSLSRGGLIATSITFIIFAILLFIGKRKSLMELVTMVSVLGVSFVVMLAIGLTPLTERLETLTGFSFESGFFRGRWIVWTHTVDLIKDFPLFGSGLGTFRQAYLGYYPAGTLRGWNQAHNDYLQLLSEVGILGFSIFLIGLAIFIYRFYLRAVFQREREDRYINLGLAMAIFSMALHSFVDFNLQIPSNGLLFTVIMSLLIARILWFEKEFAPAEG